MNLKENRYLCCCWIAEPLKIYNIVNIIHQSCGKDFFPFVVHVDVHLISIVPSVEFTCVERSWTNTMKEIARLRMTLKKIIEFKQALIDTRSTGGRNLT